MERTLRGLLASAQESDSVDGMLEEAIQSTLRQSELDDEDKQQLGKEFDLFRRELGSRLPEARVSILTEPPVAGAVTLATRLLETASEAGADGPAPSSAQGRSRAGPRRAPSVPPRLTLRKWCRFFRGTPLLVKIIFWFNIQLFIPRIAIGSFELEMNALVSPFTAAVLALSLNEAAYMAEIIRAGLLSVDEGQSEAATALGFTPMQALRRIILPQALRFTIPPRPVAAMDSYSSPTLTRWGPSLPPAPSRRRSARPAPIP